MTSHRYDRPAISLIAEDIGPNGVKMYIGGMEGARDLELLARHDIRVVVNCAVNLDFDFVQDAILAADGQKCAAGYGPLRYFKLGMIDGDGNPQFMLLGGYLILNSALEQVMPKRETYPFKDGGNVLVSCRAGRSRSVALVSLFLHKNHRDRFPTLDDAIAHVRERRELRPDEWYETPKPVLIEAARQASICIDMINTTPLAQEILAPDLAEGSHG